MAAGQALDGEDEEKVLLMMDEIVVKSERLLGPCG
jgi:hypothetical protein